MAGAGAGAGWAGLGSPRWARGRSAILRMQRGAKLCAPYMAAASAAGPANGAGGARTRDVPRRHWQPFPRFSKLWYLSGALYLVFRAKCSLPHVSRRLAFVHKVILVGKKSRSARAARVLYVKWISLAGLGPGAQSTRWARGALLCRGTGGLTHSNFLAPDQMSSMPKFNKITHDCVIRTVLKVSKSSQELNTSTFFPPLPLYSRSSEVALSIYSFNGKRNKYNCDVKNEE